MKTFHFAQKQNAKNGNRESERERGMNTNALECVVENMMKGRRSQVEIGEERRSETNARAVKKVAR